THRTAAPHLDTLAPLRSAPPLTATNYYEAMLAFLRGDLETAEREVRKWADTEWMKHEIQGVPYLHTIQGEIETARGRADEAIAGLRAGGGRPGGDRGRACGEQ